LDVTDSIISKLDDLVVMKDELTNHTVVLIEIPSNPG
jgi:hypothetical protein